MQKQSKIENQLYNSQTSNNFCDSREPKNEIDISLFQLIDAIWSRKWLVVITSTCTFLISIYYAISLPNVYSSTTRLIPAEQNGNGLNAMASQFGGLASFAGVSLGGAEGSRTKLTLEVLQSRKFMFEFIKKHNIAPQLIAAEKWDSLTNNLVYDGSIYDENSQVWTRQVSPPLVAKPSLQELYRELMRSVSIEPDKSSSAIEITVQHISPFVAQLWVTWLVEDINEEIKRQELNEANEAIKYLEEQLSKIKLSSRKNVLYQLIEEQSKTIMFANSRKQYALKTIDPPLISEFKAGPKRAVICILGALLGVILSILFVLAQYFMRIKE